MFLRWRVTIALSQGYAVSQDFFCVSRIFSFLTLVKGFREESILRRPEQSDKARLGTPVLGAEDGLQTGKLLLAFLLAPRPLRAPGTRADVVRGAGPDTLGLTHCPPPFHCQEIETLGLRFTSYPGAEVGFGCLAQVFGDAAILHHLMSSGGCHLGPESQPGGEIRVVPMADFVLLGDYDIDQPQGDKPRG